MAFGGGGGGRLEKEGVQMFQSNNGILNLQKFRPDCPLGAAKMSPL